jgi:hypothetical protein
MTKAQMIASQRKIITGNTKQTTTRDQQGVTTVLQ